MGMMEKMMSRMLRKCGKNDTLADIAIKQLEERRNQGLLSKDKANKLIEDIKNQKAAAEKESEQNNKKNGNN